MLFMALPIAKELGIDRALVTCDKNNPASAKTILRCGGVLEDERLENGVWFSDTGLRYNMAIQKGSPTKKLYGYKNPHSFSF